MTLRVPVGMLCALCVLAALPPEAWAQASGSAACGGKVIDGSGAPVEGARVVAWEMRLDNDSLSAAVVGETASDASGAFTLSVPSESPGRAGLGLVAVKEGLALAWCDWPFGGAAVTLSMGEAQTVTGKIVDAEGTGVVGAEVRAIAYAGGPPRPYQLPCIAPLDFLTARTGEGGAFSIGGFPGGATADFLVTAPGFARTHAAGDEDKRSLKGMYAAGVDAGEIIVGPESAVEGTVVRAADGQPLAGRQVLCTTKRATARFLNTSSTTGADGRFRIAGIDAGVWCVEVPAANDDEDSAAPVEVAPSIGVTVGDVTIAVGPRVDFGVKVVESMDGAPVDAAGVEISEPKAYFASTDDRGVARFSLPPGRYALGRAYKYGFKMREAGDEFAVGADCEPTLVVKLDRLPVISGIARDAAGEPVEGAALLVLPVGIVEDMYTGADGRFEMPWDPDEWPADLPSIWIILRHEEKALAAAVEVRQVNDPVEVALAPAASIDLRLADDAAQAVTGAPVMALLELGWTRLAVDRTTLFTDADGRARWSTLPAGFDCTVVARVPGFGERRSTLTLKADAGAPMPLEMTLRKADKSISGTVVGADGKPVSGAIVYARSESQTSGGASTDAEGRFTLSGLVEGDFTVEAYVTGESLSGSVAAHTGSSDVKVPLEQAARPDYGASAAASTLIGKPLPDIGEYGLASAVESASGKMMLVCFFDMNQRSSRHLVAELVRAQEDLAQKGLFVVAVDTSGMPDDERKALSQSMNIPFPLGWTKGEAQATLERWAIQGLPWLVLTDRTGDVKSEGFQLDQLQDEL